MTPPKREPTILRPGEGRAYAMGSLHAVFKADGEEGALNISVPGGFEPHMGGIAAWFRARPAAESRTDGAPAEGS